MNTRVHISRVKRIAYAVLLLCIVQWMHGGIIICIGADGHVAFEQAAAKDCCKKNENVLSPDAVLHSTFDSCVDIPVRAPKHIVSTNRMFSVYKDAAAVCLNSLNPSSLVSSLRGRHGQALQYPHDLFLGSLNTVVLLV